MVPARLSYSQAGAVRRRGVPETLVPFGRTPPAVDQAWVATRMVPVQRPTRYSRFRDAPNRRATQPKICTKCHICCLINIIERATWNLVSVIAPELRDFVLVRTNG